VHIQRALCVSFMDPEHIRVVVGALTGAAQGAVAPDLGLGNGSLGLGRISGVSETNTKDASYPFHGVVHSPEQRWATIANVDFPGDRVN
jgi:hypothetical protein